MYKILLGDRFVVFYKIIFCIAVFYGALRETEVVWALSDIFNGLMAFPNLVAVLALSIVVRKTFRENIKR